ARQPLVRLVRRADRLRRAAGRRRADRRRPDRDRGLLRGADEHELHARRLGLDQPDPLHPLDPPRPRLAGGGLDRARPLAAAGARRPLGAGTGWAASERGTGAVGGAGGL
ncbi:MAG: DoxX, partial [uncultured Thermomicrobiales bacterium]